MFDFNQYVIDVTRTESRIDKVQCNRQLAEAVTTAMISLGEILDQIKKNTYYNKPFASDKLVTEANNVLLQWKQIIDIISHDSWEHNKDTLPINPRFFHGIVGMVTESTELLKQLDFSLGRYDITNVIEELGDHDWYHGVTIDYLAQQTNQLPGNLWEQELTTNIDKLKVRYPNKFTSDNAINRDLEKENKVLKSIHKTENE